MENNSSIIPAGDDIEPVEPIAFLVAADPPPHTINFLVEGKVVGTLYLDPPMRFEGELSASAMAFWRAMIYTAPLDWLRSNAGVGRKEAGDG